MRMKVLLPDMEKRLRGSGKLTNPLRKRAGWPWRGVAAIRAGLKISHDSTVLMPSRSHATNRYARACRVAQPRTPGALANPVRATRTNRTPTPAANGKRVRF